MLREKVGGLPPPSPMLYTYILLYNNITIYVPGISKNIKADQTPQFKHKYTFNPTPQIFGLCLKQYFQSLSYSSKLLLNLGGKKEHVLFRQAYNRIRTTIFECMTIRSHPLRTKVYSPACQIAAPPDYKISISRHVSCHIDHIDKLTEKDGTGICFVFCASQCYRFI